MSFASNLVEELFDKHLLKHSFYQDWSAGKLSLDDLATYSQQYYHHVAAFPRYISATHSYCDDIKSRQVLLQNLNEEEMGQAHHPELWLQFAECLGQDRDQVENSDLIAETRELVDGFFELSRKSYASGLGALFAYEQQVPEVAKSKIEGLEKFYNITSDKGLKFFRVHLLADVGHSEACAKLLNELSSEEKKEAQWAAHKASELLWNFLNGMERLRGKAARTA